MKNQYSDFAAQLLQGKKPNGSVPGPHSELVAGQEMPKESPMLGHRQAMPDMHPDVVAHVSDYLKKRAKDFA